jgi:replication initiation protein RepC
LAVNHDDLLELSDFLRPAQGRKWLAATRDTLQASVLSNLRGKMMHQITLSNSRRSQPAAVSDSRWTALNTVQSAMEALGLRDRDIAVLRGLLTFILPDKWDQKLMVYASNSTLRARCDGIDERTLRRRLAHLCAVGLITRQQSPNRKRYVVRGVTGEPILSYGFDLSPLRDNLRRIQAIAEEHRTNLLQIKVLKALLRDRLYKLCGAGFRPETEDAGIARFHRMLRQKADIPTLESAIKAVENLLGAEEQPVVIVDDTVILTDSHGQNVRDIQSSEKEYIEELPIQANRQTTIGADQDTDVTLIECLDAAKSAMDFCEQRPQCWSDVAKLAHQLAPAIGIQPTQMHRTREALGERGASLAILGLVEAFARIKEPNRYLNALVAKASRAGLNLTRMFRSLTNTARFPAGNQDAVMV